VKGKYSPENIMKDDSLELSVIAPCFNEGANLPELANRVLRVFDTRRIDGELILVNDDSTDDTVNVINALSRQDGRVVGINHEKNIGVEGGWRSGLRVARGRFICIIDADLQYMPEDIWRLYREIIHSHADVVQGCRSHIGRIKDNRYISSIGLNSLLNFLFGMRAKDNKSGFIICRRDVFEDILQHRFKYHYFQTFITVAAKAKGYSIKEVETLFESRYLGKSFISKFPVRVYAGVCWDLLKGIVEYKLLPSHDADLTVFLKKNPPARSPDTLSMWRRVYFNFYSSLMPFHHWIISYNAIRYYRDLRKSQYLSRENIQEYQIEKLKKLIAYAYAHVPYYKEKMDAAGIRPNDIKSLDDLTKLPILDKSDIRKNLHFDLMAEGFDRKKMRKITTSGSTGEPLIVYVDKNQLEYRFANTLRNMEWTGWRFGDRQLRLWHQTMGMTKRQAFKERLDGLISRRIFFPAFELNEAMILKYLEFIKKKKPVLLDGYAECFNLLARYLETRIAEQGISPKAIISSAQTLPARSREIIERTFHTKVYDKYGAREFSAIAHQCEERGGYHINAESYIVEVVRDGKHVDAGEVGEIIVTDLNNRCVPLIRYRIGDIAISSDKLCPCGRGLPLIEGIQGRIQSIIVGTNGIYLPGTFFAHFIKDYEYAITSFQVIQEKLGSITLKIVKGLRFSQEVLDKILQILKAKLGEDMIIDVEYVSNIPLGKTGKRQHSISKLDNGLDIFGGRNVNSRGD
jgi:phenylacetate-CoA ligase